MGVLKHLRVELPLSVVRLGVGQVQGTSSDWKDLTGSFETSKPTAKNIVPLTRPCLLILSDDLIFKSMSL